MYYFIGRLTLTGGYGLWALVNDLGNEFLQWG